MQTVTVKWFGPYNLERVNLHDIAFENGVYAISRIWGDTETLLYIGRTKRQFQTRLNEHNYWLKQYRGQIKIRLGRIDLPINMHCSEKLLADIEALLIIWNETIENTSNISTYSGRTLVLNNTGRRGPLAKLISTDKLIDVS